ncbi:hypothetical protein OROGR_017684 [Orobanche gracilis]
MAAISLDLILEMESGAVELKFVLHRRPQICLCRHAVAMEFAGGEIHAPQFPWEFNRRREIDSRFFRRGAVVFFTDSTVDDGDFFFGREDAP